MNRSRWIAHLWLAFLSAATLFVLALSLRLLMWPAMVRSAHASENSTSLVPFGGVVGTLSDVGTPRTVRVGITLQVSASKEQLVAKRMKANEPAIRRWLIDYLSTRSSGDLGGAHGANRLRKEIQHELNRAFFREEGIQDVLFDEFTVQ